MRRCLLGVVIDGSIKMLKLVIAKLDQDTLQKIDDLFKFSRFVSITLPR